MKLRSLFASADRSSIEQYIELRAKSIYLGDTTSLCRVLGMLKMYVDTRDQSLAPHLLMEGYWEMWITQAVAKYLKPGMVAIDVGANFGYYALLFAALVEAKGAVHAFEPNPVLANLLRASAATNGFKQIQIYQTAASSYANAQATKPLWFSSSWAGSGSLTPFKAAGGTIDVLCRPIDAWVSGPVHFVKIDVQGHEFEVLEGMRRTIDSSPQLALAVELTPGDHVDPEVELAQVLERHPTLKLGAIGHDGIVRSIRIDEAVVPDPGSDHRMIWLSKI